MPSEELDMLKKILAKLDNPDNPTLTDITDKTTREIGRTALSLKTEFDRTITRDSDGRITQIVITDGVTTKTLDITRDADGRITSIDETVS